jgi:hypothetical protein
VKRRKFATAAVFFAALLVAALAAASVSAATSSQKAKAAAGTGVQLKAGHHSSSNSKLPHGAQTPQLVGTGSFIGTNSGPSGQKPAKGVFPGIKSITTAHDRAIPGKHGAKSTAAAAAAGAAAQPNAAVIPHAHSLPITSASYAGSAKGLNAYSQDSTGGYIDTPPDQALAEGNGYVLEAVNNVFQISDTNFGHVTNTESMESFWMPAIIATGYVNVSDPKAHYDNVTRKWYVTQIAYNGPPFPGSAVFIGVSTTSDPLSPYNIYVLDVTFDGTDCINDPFGCLGDQPLLGMNRNALFISTNSFDWTNGAFNGTQIYIIDSTALAGGALFPNIVYGDIGALFNTPEGFDGCGTFSYPVSAMCWYSVQPATTPNQSFVTSRGGTEFGMSALDWFGSNDNRIALWAFTNTSSISNFSPLIFVNYAIASTENYGFPFTDTPFFAPFAEQPSGGNTPLCDVVFGPLCEPGPIANNDDRMNEVKSVVANNQPAHNWGGVNTDALVPDPIGHLHRRSAIAYFDISATAWAGPFVIGAGVNAQNYVANWNNDVIFPAIGVSNDGLNGAMVFTVTGNTIFPSVAVSKVGDHNPVTKIPIVLLGQDVLDDFAWYEGFGPRWGDYSAAVGDGRTIYLATEYIQYQSCDTGTFLFDPTCNGTRAEGSNWGTGLVKVNV